MHTQNITENTYLKESVCVAGCAEILHSTGVDNLHKIAQEVIMTYLQANREIRVTRVEDRVETQIRSLDEQLPDRC